MTADASRVIVDLQNRYTRAQQEFAETVGREKRQHDDEVELWQKKCKDIAAKARSFQANAARLATSDGEKDAQIAELIGALATADAQCEALTAKLADAHAELGSLRDTQPKLYKDIELMTAVLEETSRERDGIAKEGSDLKVEIERLRGIEEEKAELLQKYETKDMEIQQLQATVAGLVDQVSALTGDKQKEAGLEDKLGNEVAELSALLSERNCRVQAAEAELAGLKESTTNQIRGLEQQIEVRTGQLQLMGITLSNLSMLVAPLHARAAALVEQQDPQFGDFDDEDLFG
jgi:chromosome segregation ATPase